MKFDDLTNQVIGCAIEVHKQLGPGLSGYVYKKCLVNELKTKGLQCETEVGVPVVYERVNRVVVIEMKFGNYTIRTLNLGFLVEVASGVLRVSLAKL
jgi:GxxExxY protein